MANKAIRDEAADRAEWRYPGREDYKERWAYEVAYKELVGRLRLARSRGVVREDSDDEEIYWEQVRRIGFEMANQLKAGGSALVPEEKVKVTEWSG